jgi:hypothetical protein
MLKYLLLTLVILGFAAGTQADSAFDGKWTANVVRPAPAGNQMLTINLTTAADGKVTGSMMIQDVPAPAPIEWGFVKGDLITFKVTMPFGTANLAFVYIGKMDGDHIDFGRRPEDLTMGRLVEFTAQKSK